MLKVEIELLKVREGIIKLGTMPETLPKKALYRRKITGVPIAFLTNVACRLWLIDRRRFEKTSFRQMLF